MSAILNVIYERMALQSNAKDLAWEHIAVGDSDNFEVVVTDDMIRQFADVSGDHNPLHTDPAYAMTTKFGKPVAHGMLLASFFSRLVGMYLPGKHALYLSETLSFKNPVYAGDAIMVTGRVTQKSESTKIITIAVAISKIGGEVAVDGEAKTAFI